MSANIIEFSQSPAVSLIILAILIQPPLLLLLPLLQHLARCNYFMCLDHGRPMVAICDNSSSVGGCHCILLLSSSSSLLLLSPPVDDGDAIDL
jgi:hypothetical protein